MRKFVAFTAVVALVCVTATSALAQIGRSELRGRVTDEQGGALPGVTVVITNQDAGTFREVITGGEGSYFAAQLIPGTFTITASLPGFSTFERTDFGLSVGLTLDLNIEMTIGSIEETITVSGVSPLVDLTSAEVGGTVTAGELQELPTVNRSYFSALSTLPGVQFDQSSSLGNDSIIVNGQNDDGNMVSLDGSANNDDASGTGAGGQVRVPIESVSEFQVLLNTFDAEFGRVRGAIINSITKQGTNQFTGAAFSYFTSDAMTAEDFFVANSATLEKPVTNKKEWGGVIGGPIIPDKVHFFFSLERQIVNPSRSREYETRPDLSFTLTENWRAWNTLIRIDQQINASNSWAFRWLREDAPQLNLVGGAARTVNTIGDETDNDQIWVGTYTSVLGSSMVNTARGAIASESFFRANRCWRAVGGFDVVGAQTNCPPMFEHPSFTDNGFDRADGRHDENQQWGDTFSWFVPDMMGDHDFKFGGTYHRARVTPPTQRGMNGVFDFDTDQSFDPNNPSTYPERLTIRVGNPDGLTHDMTAQAWEVFFQDKWQINNRMTIGLGLRYDTELFGPDLLADFNTVNPLLGTGHVRDWNNFAPRTSFAYDLAGDGRSVLRLGYGMFYDRTILGGLDNTLIEAAFSDSVSAQFPNNSADPGPSNGEFPTDPFLLNFAEALPITGDGGRRPGECLAVGASGVCPSVDRAAIDALFPAGTIVRNQSTVYLDSHGRKQPWMHQMTVGYERELAPTLSLSVDYIRTMGRDMLARFDYNQPTRLGTSRTDDLVYADVFGQLGPVFTAGLDANVLAMESVSRTNYDALNIMLEKRYSNRFGGRVSYAFGKSRGNSYNQDSRISSQVGTALNLDDWYQPMATDRRHILSVSGRTELPGGVTVSGVIRYMSAQPFSIVDDNFDLDRNGILFDPLPPGTYSGVGVNAVTVDNNPDYTGGYAGARYADFLQADMRFGYRVRHYQEQTIDIFFDIFNITNRANFNNPNGDRRSGNFLRLLTLRAGSGVPRQGQFGLRWGF